MRIKRMIVGRPFLHIAGVVGIVCACFCCINVAYSTDCDCTQATTRSTTGCPSATLCEAIARPAAPSDCPDEAANYDPGNVDYMTACKNSNGTGDFCSAVTNVVCANKYRCSWNGVNGNNCVKGVAVTVEGVQQVVYANPAYVNGSCTLVYQCP